MVTRYEDNQNALEAERRQRERAARQLASRKRPKVEALVLEDEWDLSSGYQKCGGGRRVIRKPLGNS